MVVRPRLETSEILMLCIVNSDSIAMVKQIVARAVICIIALFVHMRMSITILLGAKIHFGLKKGKIE